MTVPLHHPVDILRFNTCGSVDDGKSTLIGRLLYDSKSLMEDQIEALERSADITGGGQINLANLTDGLRAEREQGITIDVAYRYFATPRRKFIIADTPGPRAIHPQHGHRRLRRQPLHRARGRAPGRHRAKPPPHLHRLAAAHSAPRHRRQQDGPGGLERGALHRNPRPVRGVPAAPRREGREVHPAQRAQRRQRRRSLQAHAVVSGPDAAGPSGNRPHRQRLEPQRLSPARAMGQSPEQSDRPEPARLPRLQRPDRRRHRARRPESHGAAQRPQQHREGNLDLTTARCRKPSARNPSPSCSNTTSTSAAAT